MLLIFYRGLVALAALSCSSAFASSYPTVSELRAAISAAAAVTKLDGLTLHMEDAREAGIKLPLMAAGLNLNTGICQIFYNPTPEQGLTRFFESVSQKDMPVWLSAIAVHEATHCVEQREAYINGRFDKVLPPGVDRNGMTLKGYLGVVKSGAVETWGEALADIASIQYLKRVAPEHWLSFAHAIMTMRHNLAAKWPSHDTSPWIKNLIAERGPGSPQLNCFEEAFLLRRTLRPQ